MMNLVVVLIAISIASLIGGVAAGFLHWPEWITFAIAGAIIIACTSCC